MAGQLSGVGQPHSLGHPTGIATHRLDLSAPKICLHLKPPEIHILHRNPETAQPSFPLQKIPNSQTHVPESVAPRSHPLWELKSKSRLKVFAANDEKWMAAEAAED
jgi:hypothetical protein